MSAGSPEEEYEVVPYVRVFSVFDPLGKYAPNVDYASLDEALGSVRAMFDAGAYGAQIIATDRPLAALKGEAAPSNIGTEA